VRRERAFTTAQVGIVADVYAEPPADADGAVGWGAAAHREGGASPAGSAGSETSSSAEPGARGDAPTHPGRSGH
jgi:hypothetical protein